MTERRVPDEPVPFLHREGEVADRCEARGWPEGVELNETAGPHISFLTLEQ